MPNLSAPRYGRKGSVYFAERASDRCIKIGFSTNLGQRLPTLAWETREPVRLLGVTEWFRPVEPLLLWIETFTTLSS